MDTGPPDRSIEAWPRPLSTGPGRVLKYVVFAGAAVATTLVLTLILFGAVFWSSASRLVDEETPRPEARVDLARQIRRSFGVPLPGAARLLRARLRRGSFRPDGDRWFLLQLPPGGGAAFEAQLRAVARNKDLGPVKIQLNRPGRDDDRDDWTKFPPLGARIWRTEPDLDEVYVRGSQFFYRWVL